ncbi:ATP-binding cassette domain-containing protein [Actinospica durhamensis]|uniref:ATP-binding cassette domain-containing protein n=1 Tax=Actinospica durhamensis TaxID=1508375 RepID=A0A941IPW1_9ACTN|nr:ABC transporter ATP-binding protein [Actinospica durhamensis]MBR7832333.1 ATP-binding cassette domain-containing protein [Actinospica durhamensis]
MTWGVSWMLSLALMPAVIGRAIDRGLVHRSASGLWEWASVAIGLALFTAMAGGMRHRSAMTNWLSAAYLAIQITSRQSVKVGADLPRLIASGDVLAIGTTDVEAIGSTFDIWARLTGSCVSVVAVAVILLTSSVPLGLVVLVGVPVMMIGTVLLLRPLRRRQDEYRDLQGSLTDQTIDIAQGIRILRGIGGEETFSARYATMSQRLRVLGVGVGRIEALLAGQQVLLPGLLTALVTWLAAHFALRGDITIGQLVAFYGYASFLVLPLSTFGEAADAFTRGHVAADHIIRVLRLASPITEPEQPQPMPVDGAVLEERESGLRIEPDRFLAVACADPGDATTLAERLARYVDSGEARLGEVPLKELKVGQVRQRILLSDNADRIFAGTLRASLSGVTTATDEQLRDALKAASAEDVLAGLDAGLDTPVEEKGRNFSGGQLQRLRLARALIADPEILVAVEATSAVDAHTEARIAERIGAYRRSRAVDGRNAADERNVDGGPDTANGRNAADGRNANGDSGADGISRPGGSHGADSLSHVGAQSGASGGGFDADADGPAVRTTVLFTTSPLVLDRADSVAYVENGRVTSVATHAELLARDAGYRSLVTRGESDEQPDGKPQDESHGQPGSELQDQRLLGQAGGELQDRQLLGQSGSEFQDRQLVGQPGGQPQDEEGPDQPQDSSAVESPIPGADPDLTHVPEGALS